MSLINQYKKCQICKKKYMFNPDAGQMWCPNCGPNSMPGAGDITWKKKDKGIKLGDVKGKL